MRLHKRSASERRGLVVTHRTPARFLLSQAALNGCRFVVLDPHAGAGDDSLAATLAPLARAMVCEPVSENREMLEVARYVAELGRKRLAGDPNRTPVIVCIDKATALLARSQIGEPLGKLIETIAQEFRKVNIFALCSAQIWIAARSGGSSALRDSFASAYVHRMRRNQARLLLPTDEARQVETLGTGQAVLWRTSGETQTIVIPNTTLHDVVQVAQRLRTAPGVDGAYPPAYFSTDGPASSLFDPDVAVSGNVSGEISGNLNGAVSGLMSDVKAVRALELFLEGKGQREILAEVWGVTGGPPYQQAARQFNEILRQQIRSGYGE